MPRPRPTVGSTTGLTGTSGTSGGSPTISGGPVPAGSIIPASLKTTPTSPTGAGQVLGYDGTGFAWVAPGGSSAAVLTNRGVWAVSTSYAVGDVVVNGSTTYACTTSHTSGVTFSGTNWVALGSTAGGLASITITGTPSAGQVLQATSSTAATWVTPTSPQSTLGTIQTAASTPVTGRVNRYDASSGALSLTMPAVAAAGGSFSVQKTDSSTNTVTIGGVTLDKPKALVEFVSDGTVWAQVNASTGSPQTPDGGSGLGSVTVSGTPTAGQVLTASSGTAASWSTPASGAGDATTAAKGVVQLAGDLGGTASAPTVPGLAGKYTKPGPGIPATDLTAAVQSAVAAAGTAVQSVNGKTGTSVTLNASDVGAVASVVGQTGAVTGAQIAADPALTGTYASLAEQRPGLSPMVGCLGDSLMINNDVAGTQRNDSPLHLATVLSGGRIRYAYMGGVGGQNSSQILARVNDFVATGARTILVLMGANDGGGAGFPGFRANLDATINGIIARGGTPVLVTSPPRGTAGSPPTVQVRLSINAYNHYVRGLAQKLGVPLVEWWSIYADTTTEAFAAGMTSDGVHPTNNAATTAAAQAIVDALSPLLPPASPPLVGSNTDASNLMPNGLLLNSSGGVATGYGAMSGGGTTPSIVAKAVGNAQRFTIAGNTNAWLMNNGTPAAITVVPGHTYRATALLSWSGGCIPRMQIDTGTGGGITSYAVWKPMNAAAVAAATDCAVVFDFVPPAGVTQVAYEWVLPSTGLTGWCEISRIGLVDLTAQGIEF